MNFTDVELERYARHIVLAEIGGAGQAALKAGHVVVVGAGGIGSPAIQYLAAAGIGRLTIVDDDRVDLSNLQRQAIFTTGDVGAEKSATAADAARRINPHVAANPVTARIDAGNVDTIIAGADAVIDGTDNFPTRMIVADACLRHRIPLISAAIGQFDGQLAVFRGWEADRPCYRCWVGDDPERAGINCAEQGVLGAMTGVMGSLAALEAIRAITGFGADTAGRLLLADALDFRFRTLSLPKDPGCTACGAD